MAMAKNKNKETVGKVSIADMRAMINKKSGHEVAFDLQEDNPTEVNEWIPTGSTVLDAILVRGRWGGIAGNGRITTIEGFEGTGKSYLAAQIAANAQKMGYMVFYFDSENAIDPEFLKKSGCNLTELLYIQAESVEFVLETIEDALKNANGTKCFFVWDSVAMTPTKTDIEGTFDPSESMAVKARILSKGMSKLVQPLANTDSSLLILNQLKINLACQNPKYAPDTEKYSSSGGKSILYATSMRIFLTMKNGKDTFVVDERGYRIGSEVKAKIVKSRYGSQGRECSFKIIWSDNEKIGVKNDESIFEALTPFMQQSGPYYSLDGKQKFLRSEWDELMKGEEFRKKALDMIESEIIVKFDKRLESADKYYDIVDQNDKE